MPLFFDKEIDTGGRICIWEITESQEQLEQISQISTIESENGIKIISVSRKMELITTRILLSKMLPEFDAAKLFYNENGKPVIAGTQKHISISHTKQFVAVAVHEKKIIGIDIEMITPRIEKIKNRFLNDQEMEWTTGAYSLEKLYILWGAKECAFKIYSKGGIDFKKMLHVKSFNYSQKGDSIVELSKNNVTCAYPFYWEQTSELMLVYALEN